MSAVLCSSACSQGEKQDSGTDSGLKQDAGDGKDNGTADIDIDSDADADADADADSDADADVDPDCEGKDNFTFCDKDTSDLPNGDFEYDICVNEQCISPGSCNNKSCNSPGPNFKLTPVDVDADNYIRTEPAAGSGQYVVTDKTTKLMWQGCAAGRTGPDCESGTDADVDSDADADADANVDAAAMASGANKGLDWVEALRYCDGLSWAGYDDWYLPDQWELQSIVDYSSSSPAVDVEVFPISGRFWTSSDSCPVSKAWMYSLGNGRMETQEKHYVRSVICVRRGTQTSPRDRYDRSLPVDGEPVVLDRATGLMWQGCGAGQAGDVDYCQGDIWVYGWDDAKLYCSILSWGGFDDWRLPDVKELASIVDDRECDRCRIDPMAFPYACPASFKCTGQYMTSTTASSDEVWYIGFQNYYSNRYIAEMNTTEKDEEYFYVRCVRSGL